MRVLGILLTPILCVAQQVPWTAPLQSREPDTFQLKWPVKRVAIIGGGVSGLIAYREFEQAGFEQVRLFERDSLPGGNWLYTEDIPGDAPIPNVEPSIGDYVPSVLPPGSTYPSEKIYSDGEERWREHRAPKPVWESLESNAPAPIQQITEIPWPPGTPWHLPHRLLGRYLRAFASFHNVNANDDNSDVSYRTRVERVEKRRNPATQDEEGWTLTLKRVELLDSKAKVTWWTETSAVEISREVSHSARRIYQSIRPANPNLPDNAGRNHLSRLPANISIVPEIRQFHAHNQTVELVNGTFLEHIDQVVFATGYRYSFPFLPQFHRETGSTDRHIVTDGTHLRALHLDFVSIEEPTIGFLNMNWGMQSFTYAEYLSVALAKVWSAKASLPSQDEMWRAHDRRVEERGGYGRHLQFLGEDRNSAIIRYFVGWLNDAAVKFGGKQLDGEDKNYHEIMTTWIKSMYPSYNLRDSSKEERQSVQSVDWIYGEDW
ncbi:unnamed protein product [Mycena citricolor]|uniref:FAD/NAD(P)-binding domain-containing protein n=1 Tax=Mycena citricolor TaxID=2018698 RepID=A0AAD2K1Y7_9AGAR|nr:unnamed protein product [Mycena citricolor]